MISSTTSPGESCGGPALICSDAGGKREGGKGGVSSGRTMESGCAGVERLAVGAAGGTPVSAASGALAALTVLSSVVSWPLPSATSEPASDGFWVKRCRHAANDSLARGGLGGFGGSTGIGGGGVGFLTGSADGCKGGGGGGGGGMGA